MNACPLLTSTYLCTSSAAAFSRLYGELSTDLQLSFTCGFVENQTLLRVKSYHQSSPRTSPFCLEGWQDERDIVWLVADMYLQEQTLELQDKNKHSYDLPLTRSGHIYFSKRLCMKGTTEQEEETLMERSTINSKIATVCLYISHQALLYLCIPSIDFESRCVICLPY